jgi:hypothetical protein
MVGLLNVNLEAVWADVTTPTFTCALFQLALLPALRAWHLYHGGMVEAFAMFETLAQGCLPLLDWTWIDPLCVHVIIRWSYLPPTTLDLPSVFNVVVIPCNLFDNMGPAIFVGYRLLSRVCMHRRGDWSWCRHTCLGRSKIRIVLLQQLANPVLWHTHYFGASCCNTNCALWGHTLNSSATWCNIKKGREYLTIVKTVVFSDTTPLTQKTVHSHN